MTEYTNESPFDPKWEMTPEQIAEVFSLDKNKKYKTMSVDEVDGGIKGQAVPELSAENNMGPVDTGISQYQIEKLLLTQNYLALLTSIQARLNKLYDDRGNSTISKSSEISSAEIDQAFVDKITGLKGIRANVISLYKLALESASDADIVAAKDTFIELAKGYHLIF